ncbi:hypothetical protein ACWIE7_19125 [Dietzia sp. NPDC055343]
MFEQPTLTQQAALIAVTAGSRLKPFRRTYGGHERPAFALYLLDAQLASQIHSHLRIVEVTLRQQMHMALSDAYGDRWFDNATGAGLSQDAQKRVREAHELLRPRRQAQSFQPSPDKMVAAMMLGFWTSLLRAPHDVDHETTLWGPALESCFNGARQPTTPAWTMTDAQKVCQRLNWARNRVNHCESVVFGFPQPGQVQGVQLRHSPASIVEDCRTLVGRFSSEVEEWMRASNTLDQIINDPAAQKALAYSASQPKRQIMSSPGFCRGWLSGVDEVVDGFG